MRGREEGRWEKGREERGRREEGRREERERKWGRRGKWKGRVKGRGSPWLSPLATRLHLALELHEETNTAALVVMHNHPHFTKVYSMCISTVSTYSAPLGFSHDVITFKNMKIYRKTAAMLD